MCSSASHTCFGSPKVPLVSDVILCCVLVSSHPCYVILIQVTECTRWVAVRDAVAEQETNTKGGPLRDPGHQERVDFVRQYAIRAWFFLVICYPYRNSFI